MQNEQKRSFPMVVETIYELLQSDTFHKHYEAHQNYWDRQRETFTFIETASDRRYEAEQAADRIQSTLSLLNVFINDEEKKLADLRATLDDLRNQH